MKTFLLISLFMYSTAQATGFSDSVQLSDVVIQSDGTVADLARWNSPMSCKNGGFSFDISVIRKSGVGDVLFEINDGLGNKFPITESTQLSFSKLSPFVELKNPNSGTYDPSCKCYINPGSDAEIKITNRMFHVQISDQKCGFTLQDLFSDETLWVDKEFGTSLSGVTAKLAYHLTKSDNFEENSCHKLAIVGADKVEQVLDDNGGQVDVVLPARFYSFASCITPRKKPAANGHDFQLAVAMISVKNQ